MQRTFNDCLIEDGLARIDFDRVTAWLGSTYWSPAIERALVERAARGSALVVGAYAGGTQIGYARVISDKATFGYLADVFVDSNHRGKGLARAMVQFALEHPDLQGMRTWMLITKDAHGVYAPLGFTPVRNAERVMEIRTRHF